MAHVFTIEDVRVPEILMKEELADRLRVSLRQLDRLRRAKTHPAIKQLDGPGAPRFCGKTYAEWRDGGKRERKFFSKAG